VARASIADPLVHDESGWIVADDAPARAWSDAVNALCLDPVFASRLGVAARRVLEAQHEPTALARRVLDVVETVVAASAVGLVFGIGWAVLRRSLASPFGFGPMLAMGALLALLAPIGPLAH